mmetsp:Transcript_33135/g.105603  ORF Transcript_33135/g.105603 Transcript_33135/m.105603 type:complete len:397 (-) Transcript_33135:270-1460(-)
MVARRPSVRAVTSPNFSDWAATPRSQSATATLASSTALRMSSSRRLCSEDSCFQIPLARSICSCSAAFFVSASRTSFARRSSRVWLASVSTRSTSACERPSSALRIASSRSISIRALSCAAILSASSLLSSCVSTLPMRFFASAAFSFSDDSAASACRRAPDASSSRSSSAVRAFSSAVRTASCSLSSLLSTSRMDSSSVSFAGAMAGETWMSLSSSRSSCARSAATGRGCGMKILSMISSMSSLFCTSSRRRSAWALLGRPSEYTLPTMEYCESAVPGRDEGTARAGTMSMRGVSSAAAPSCPGAMSASSSALPAPWGIPSSGGVAGREAARVLAVLGRLYSLKLPPGLECREDAWGTKAAEICPAPPPHAAVPLSAESRGAVQMSGPPLPPPSP